MSTPLSVENRKKKRMHEDSDLFENFLNEGTDFCDNFFSAWRGLLGTFGGKIVGKSFKNFCEKYC